jgi:protein TonB
MENENAIKNFDDLIFENRNKTYGAYAIRKSYNDNVNKAVFIALLSVGIIVILSSFSASTKDDAPKNPDGGKPNTLLPDPVVIVEPPPAKEIPHVRSVSNNVQPVVTTDKVDDKPIETTNTINSDGQDTGDIVIATTGAVIDSGTVVIEPPVIVAPKIFNHVENMPKFIGGETAMIRFIQRTFHYPAVARRMGNEGTVFVSFVIDAEGNITMVKVDKGVSKECDEEAIRIIEKMPKWIAGRQGDMPVSVRQCLPIKFTLNHDL